MKKRDIVFLLIISAVCLVAIFFIARSYARREAANMYMEWQEQHILAHEKAELETQKELEKYMQELDHVSKTIIDISEVMVPSSPVTEDDLTPTPEPTEEPTTTPN